MTAADLHGRRPARRQRRAARGGVKVRMVQLLGSRVVERCAEKGRRLLRRLPLDVLHNVILYPLDIFLCTVCLCADWHIVHDRFGASCKMQGYPLGRSTAW